MAVMRWRAHRLMACFLSETFQTMFGVQKNWEKSVWLLCQILKHVGQNFTPDLIGKMTFFVRIFFTNIMSQIQL